MTDSSSHLNSHIAPAVQPSVDPTLSPTKASHPFYTASQVDEPEEDDSTIKCICGFKHDDGNSVFCERCNTWQHTVCYYYDEENDRVPSKDELELILHFCTDCEPRPIDTHAAINRQKTRKGELDYDDRKARKPASKSHKKKTKALESNGVSINGWSPDGDGSHERTIRSPRDHVPSVKKSKTNHRPTNSTNLPALSQQVTSHPHKRSGSALQSPSKSAVRLSSNGFTKEEYSDEFLQLYDDDPGEQTMSTNLFNNISITDTLSSWTYNPQKLKDDTRGFSRADVFYRIEQPLENIIGQPPRKQCREETGVTKNGRHPRWIYLTSDGFTKQNSIIGELKGSIGHMKDYISDPTNRWDWLRHPAPFVFFHPKLPIFIDTRREGTLCRYLRRSCRPNLSMTTFLENESYHFCFTAKEDIDHGQEMTIGWVLDEHMRKFSSNKIDMAQDLSPEGEEYFTDWVGKVSPEFGGCACGMPDSCWFVRYDPENKASLRGKGGHSKRRSQSNAQDTSEAEEAASTSRSNSGSRDMTPVGHSAHTLGFGLEISDREKRKIAALEKNFELLENDKQQPATKKKKRHSGSNTNTPGPGTSVRLTFDCVGKDHTDKNKQRQLGHATMSLSQPNTPSLPSRSQYVDASTTAKRVSPTSKGSSSLGRPRNVNPDPFKKKPSRPNTPPIPSPLSRPNYVSNATQTDLDDDTDNWYKPLSSSVRAKKPYMSLTKRLLLRSQHDRKKFEERKRAASISPSQQSSGIRGDTAVAKLHRSQPQEDITMQDSGHLRADGDSTQAPDRSSDLSAKLPSCDVKPPPWPSFDKPAPVNGFRVTDLHVQLPPKPLHTLDSTSKTPLNQTPISTLPPQPPCTQTSTLSHPPFITPSSTGLIQPSPAKKKVSLSDYLKRKGSHSTDAKQLGGSPELSHSSLKPPPALTAANGASTFEGSAVVDTPCKEESNPLESVPGVKAASPTPEEKPLT